MKNILKSIIAGVVTATLISVNAFAAVSGTVTASALNVRSLPSTDSDIVGQLINGESVTITETTNNWHKILYNGTVAYVSADHISTIFNGNISVTNNATTGVISADFLNVRSYPSSDSSVIGMLTYGETVNIIETANNWHKISYNGSYAYISADYVSNAKSTANSGIITADVLNVRSYPSSDSGVIGMLTYGETVNIIETANNWHKISYNGSYAYISADYVAQNSSQVTNPTSALPAQNTTYSSSGSSKGEALVEFAKKYIGTPYVYGGMSPSGFDCSGFVKFCYANMGVDINRISYDQAKNGYEVSRDNMKPGDILCFVSSVGGSYIGHTGIYVGNGQFIHSPREGYTVEIIPLTSGSYSQRLAHVRRIFD